MARLRVLFGVLLWVCLITAGIVLYGYLPSQKVATALRRGKKVVSYFKRDLIPLKVRFPQKYLFFIGKNFQKDLQKDTPSSRLIREFSYNRLFLSSDSQIEIQKRGQQWILKDEPLNQHYVIRKISDGFKVYQDVYLLPDDAINFWTGEVFIVVGRVKKKIPHDKFCLVEIELFPDRAYLLTNKAVFTYSQDNGTFVEVVDGLLAGKNGDKVKGEINRILSEKKAKILAILTPVVQEIVESALPHLRNGVTASIANHQDALSELVQRELLEKKLIPAIQKEAWPIIEKKAPPVLEPIAQELWSQLPLTGIVTRGILHKIYLSKKSAIDRFNEYVQNKAIPILNKNQDKLIEMARDIAGKIATKKSVISALEEGSNAVFSHEKFKSVLQKIFMEGIVKNQALKKAFLDKWSTMENAFAQISEELEAPIRRAVDLILCKDGDFRKGINPSLARVLRQQILWKDMQWIQVRAGSGRQPLSAQMTFRGQLR